MQWIYRAKKHFNLKEADIYSLLIPIHYRISVEQIKAMAEASNMQDLTIEQMYEDCLYHLYTADRRQNPYSIASINMYLFLKEEELRKLTTAMECIRYGLNSGETLGYVGGKI